MIKETPFRKIETPKEKIITPKEFSQTPFREMPLSQSFNIPPYPSSSASNRKACKSFPCLYVRNADCVLGLREEFHDK